MMKEFERIKLEINSGIGIITMCYPKVLNALSNKTLEELSEAIDIIEKDQSVLGLIITGEGKAFVAGADISQMQWGGMKNG